MRDGEVEGNKSPQPLRLLKDCTRNSPESDAEGEPSGKSASGRSACLVLFP